VDIGYLRIEFGCLVPSLQVAPVTVVQVADLDLGHDGSCAMHSFRVIVVLLAVAMGGIWMTAELAQACAMSQFPRMTVGRERHILVRRAS
jgi:hypothetical protein